MTIFLLISGFVLLIVGAEALVRGASRIAATLGVKPLIIGLTIVSLGTSAPELAISIHSSLAGKAGIALGNIIGSNIFNVLFILGLSALVVPLTVSQQLIRLDVPFMIGISILTLLLGLDGNIGQLDGGILFTLAILYILFLIWQSRSENPLIEKEYEQQYSAEKLDHQPSWVRNISYVLAGLALLVLGSRWLVNSAVIIAEALGISELIIGLTIIALGTSLPEVATSIVAGIRGERDIAVGNVVGSNLFNLMAVLGLTGIVAPGGITITREVLEFDLPVMIAVAVACLPIFFTGHLIARWEGALFLGYYVVYSLYLFLAASRSQELPFFEHVMMWFVIPLTVITLGVGTYRALRAR